MKIDAASAPVIAAIAALIGAGVAGFLQLLSQWLTRRSEERRQFRQLVVQTAIENWRFCSDLAVKEAEANPGTRNEIHPLDTFLLHMIKFSELLDERHLTPEVVRTKLQEAQAIINVATEESRKFVAGEVQHESPLAYKQARTTGAPSAGTDSK